MMSPSKKFFDIYPPQHRQEKKEVHLPKKKISQLEKKKKPGKRVIPRIRFESRKTILIGSVLILGLIFAYYSFSGVKIEIWPKTQNYHFQEKIEVSAKQNQIDYENKVLPGKIAQITQEDSQEFPAKERVYKEEKAKGQIRVYNNYSASSQVLVATTRFVSADGKLFRSVKKVTIPGQSKEEGKLVQGFLDVEVIAAEAGQEYNIGPTTFSIPGFAGTPKYTAFYGKSTLAMSGGFKGEVPKVTEEESESAKNVLVSRLQAKGKNVLKKETTKDFVLLDEALLQEVTEVTPTFPQELKTQSYKLQVKLRSQGLTFKLSNLRDFAEKFILSQLLPNELLAEGFWTEKKIVPDSLKIDYKFESMDWQTEKMVLNLDFSAKVYLDLDELSLKKSLAGKSLLETQKILENQLQISKAKIKVLPFLPSKIPQNLNKIKIKMNLEGVAR